MNYLLYAGCFLASCMLPAAAIAQSERVATDRGVVLGISEDAVLSWKGVPFAAPPVGALRWRAPQPVTQWTGIRKADAYRNDCMQIPFPSDAAPLGTPPAEDCLYANIWRPAGVKAKLPVIVWIYGGGFVNGGASPPTYSGANIAKQGVMFMSFNYRVGRFGTFAHPLLTAEKADGGLLGNYGFMDQIAALKWVRRNIATFGGDPDNVTIIGESAGGMSVHMLVTSPLAKGLFARAVVMSGGAGATMSGKGLADIEQIGLAFAQSKGITVEDTQALTKLRALTAEQVTDGLNMMALFKPDAAPTFASPFVDGKIAVDATAAYQSGRFSKVPMMIGATSADMGGKTGIMVAGARSASAIISKQSVPVYAYRFSYVAQSVGKPGAGHATEIPFFFDTAAIKYGDKVTPRDLAMSATISRYIVNFAKKGDPYGPGRPLWPTYSRKGDQLMDFAEDGTAMSQQDPWGADIDAAGGVNPTD